MAAMDLLQELLPGTLGQANRLLRLRTPLAGANLVPERLDGVESVDYGGFRFDLTALSPDAHVSLDPLLGAPVLLELLPDDSRINLRPFHGHVTAIERVGSNGGLARYRLTIEPWLALLHYRQDSFAFHGMTVIEIVEAVFGHYQKGVVAPAWRFELVDQSVYKKRSLTTQYQESDHAFVSRLLAEEGLFYWFEHQGDLSAPTLGVHTMVMADSNEAFQPDDARTIRYHRGNTTERTDTIQHWAPDRRWQTSRVARASWDYRTLSLRPAGADATGPATPTVDDDTAGPYAWIDSAQGQYRARQQLDAQQVTAALIRGAGRVRRLAPGSCLILTQHPTQTADPLAVLAVHHHARNNLSAEVQSAIGKALGPAVATEVGKVRHASEGWHPAPLGPRAAMISFVIPAKAGIQVAVTNPEMDFGLRRNDGHPRFFEGSSEGSASATPHPSGDGGGSGTDTTPFYRNTFTALPIARTYRPHTADGHGLRRQPVPSATGSQTAIVTGSGDPIQTDRDRRVIVQQHWQRGSNAASRLDHPRKANAPADQTAGTWARVMTPLAGANWGSVMTPRVGQEVWLDYLEGDIDRPVVVAGLYNGQGNHDAPYNQQAGGPSNATGNAAAWFTGNGHPGVLSGFKTQDLATSQTGTGGYRQLRFDDTPKQGHIQLSTTDYATALTLGHFKHLDNNARKTNLGYGADLATAAQGALRGGAGLLLSSARGASQMDAASPVGVLETTTQLIAGLADVAHKQGAGLPEEPQAKKLHAVTERADLAQSLRATREGHASGAGIGGGEGTAAGWSKPQLVVHGQAGLIAVTPKNAVYVSGKDTVLAASQDINLAAQGKLAIVAARGIALYAQGSAPADSRPVTHTGIALHAATGTVSVEAQQDQATFAAEKVIQLASTEGNITVGAQSHVLLTAAGAYLKLGGTNIEIGGPGKAFFKAAQRELVGGASGSAPKVTLAKAKAGACEFRTRKAAQDGAGVVHV